MSNKNQMTRKSRFEDAQDAKNGAQYLDLAYGFSTTAKGKRKAPEFVDLVKLSLSTGIMTAHEIKHEFNLDMDTVRRGRPTGISTENRSKFMAISTLRAYVLTMDA